MKKNKLLSLVIIILVLTVLMISCKQEPTQSAPAIQESDDSAQGSNSSSFKYTQAYIDSHRPQQFSLSLAIDSSPAFLDLRINTDSLYKKFYTFETYLKKIGSKWRSTSNWEVVELSEALEIPYAFLYCYLTTDSTRFVKGEEKTIAGVVCEKYTYPSTNGTFDYYIDPDTGICFECTKSGSSNPANNVSVRVTSYSTTI